MSSVVPGINTDVGGGLSPIPANTALGNFTGAVALPTPQTKSAWITWLDVPTNSDPRLSDARDWFASSVSQAEAEAGTEVIDRKWSALRVRQSTRVNPDFDPTGNLFTIGTTTNAQRLRLRRRFAGAGDFSQLSIDFSGDNCRIQTQHAGNNPNPLNLGTAGVERLFIAADATRVGIGGAPTTRPLEIFAGTAGFRLQSSSVVSPPAYTEIARTFDFLTWQDSTSPFNTCTDLVANSNQFNNHSVRLFVHTSGTSAPVLHSVFHASGRLSVGTDVDNGTDRLQVNGNLTASGTLTAPGFATATGTHATTTTKESNFLTQTRQSSSGRMGYRIVAASNDVAFCRYNDATVNAEIGTAHASGSTEIWAGGASRLIVASNGNLTASGTIAAVKSSVSATNFEHCVIDPTSDASNYRIGSRIGSAGGTTRGLQFGAYNAAGAWTSWLGIDTSGNATVNQLIVGGSGSASAPLIFLNGAGTGNAIGLYRSGFDCIFAAQGVPVLRASYAAGICTVRDNHFGITNAQFDAATVGADTRWSRSSAGVWRAGTTANNALGSVELFNLTAGGNITATGFITSAFQSLSADPSTIDIPSGSNRIVKNTTSGEVRDWVNDGGIMKKSPAYT